MLCKGNVLDTLKHRMRLYGLTQCTVSGASGRIFWALPSLMFGLDIALHQRHLQAFTHLLALPCKLIRGDLQAMVNVDSANLTWPLEGAGLQQSG